MAEAGKIGCGSGPGSGFGSRLQLRPGQIAVSCSQKCFAFLWLRYDKNLDFCVSSVVFWSPEAAGVEQQQQAGLHRPRELVRGRRDEEKAGKSLQPADDKTPSLFGMVRSFRIAATEC